MQVLGDDLLDPNKLSKKLIKLEDRSQHNNFRFGSLTEDPNKTWNDLNKKYRTSFLII